LVAWSLRNCWENRGWHLFLQILEGEFDSIPLNGKTIKQFFTKLFSRVVFYYIFIVLIFSLVPFVIFIFWFVWYNFHFLILALHCFFIFSWFPCLILFVFPKEFLGNVEFSIFGLWNRTFYLSTKHLICFKY